MLTIFLDDKSFHSLKQCIPAGSRANIIIESALQLKRFGSDAVITCEATEARTLLLYADSCPSVVESVHNALRSAELPVDP